MSGPRIRTIKPEWLEDEQLLRAGSHARVLSVALILVADDYGRGRCIPEALAAQVFPFEQESSRVFRESLARLSAMHFVGVYRVRDQQYFEIRNWRRHQRVDKPGKPRVPTPNANDFIEIESSGDSREYVANDSRESRESLAPDRDLDLDQEGDARARAIHVLGSTGGATGTGVPNTPTPPRCEPSQNFTPAANTDAELSTCETQRHTTTLKAKSGPSRLWEIWQELADVEAIAGPPSDQEEKLLEAAWVQLGRRDARDPEGLFRRMAVAYVEAERKRGRVLELTFFVRDFPKWAELVARATSNGSQAALRPEYRPFPEIEEVPK